MSSQIVYRLSLEQEVVFRNANGDPNLVRSEGFIPGSNIWGALADYLLRPSSWNLDNADFKDLFSGGKLLFLNAYPYANTAYSPAKARYLPAPLSFRQVKTDEERGYDLSVSDPPADESLTGIAGSFVYFDSNETVFRHSIQSRFNYHTTRSRAKGRATEDEGDVFVYEALLPGQQFEGRILGSDEDLNRLYQTTGRAEILLRLGRSRAVQYGGNVRLNLSPPLDFEREVALPDDEIEGDRLVVTLLSPLLNRNPYGYNSLEFPTEALARLLDAANPPELVQEAVFARSVTVGGYWTPWKMPRQQWTGLAAGSIVVFKTKSPLKAFQPTKVEFSSLGERVNEGFGRFALNWHSEHFELNFQPSPKTVLRKPTNLPEPLPLMVKQLAEARWLKQAESAGLQRAERFKDSLGRVSPALLNRLRQIFSDNTSLNDIANYFKDEADNTKRLRATAWQQLEHLRARDEGTSLLGAIQLVLRSELNSPLFNLDSGKSLPIFEQAGWKPTEQEIEHLKTNMIRRYLVSMMEQMSRQQRLNYDV